MMSVVCSMTGWRKSNSNEYATRLMASGGYWTLCDYNDDTKIVTALCVLFMLVVMIDMA